MHFWNLFIQFLFSYNVFPRIFLPLYFSTLLGDKRIQLLLSFILDDFLHFYFTIIHYYFVLIFV